MNCAQCEERMSDYLESALSAGDSGGVESHLQSCAACTELLAGMRDVLVWAKTFPVYEAPLWLPARIVANTPRVERESWRDTLRSAWSWVIEPRAAMAVLSGPMTAHARAADYFLICLAGALGQSTPEAMGESPTPQGGLSLTTRSGFLLNPIGQAYAHSMPFSHPRIRCGSRD